MGSQVFLLPIRLRLFVVLSGSHWSTQSFYIFWLPVLWKPYVLPHKGLELLTVGLKVQRSPDWASGARTEACHSVSCCPFEHSPMFYGVLYFQRYSWFCFFHVSLLRVSMFSCFQFCEEGEFSPHKELEPLTVGIKVQRSTDWASGAWTEAYYIVSPC